MRRKCHDFVFGLGGESSIRTYESFGGGLLCDEEQICGLIYTANEARKEADRINYTGEMVINALNNLKVLKLDYSSYASALKKECDNIENALFTHIQDLTAYATNVENIDDSMKKGFEECISKDKDAAPGVVVGAGFGKVENVEVDDVEYINAVCAVMKEYGYTSYEEAIAKIKLDMAKAYAVEATKDFAKMEGIKSTPVEIETNWIDEAAKATGNFLFRVVKRLVGRALEDVKSIFEIPVLLMELPENAYTLYQYIDENGIVKVFSDACEETGNEISVAWDTICEGTADEIADVVGDTIYTTAEILIPAGKIAKATKATKVTKAAKVVGKVEDISDFSKDVKNASAFAQTAQNAAQKINRFSDVVETSQNLQEYADRVEGESGSNAELKTKAEKAIQELITSTPGGNTKSMAVAAYDVKTGKIVADFAGPIPDEISSVLIERANKIGGIGSLGVTDRNTVGVCAEFRTVNQLLLGGSDISNIRLTEAIRPRTGKIRPYCDNCLEIFFDILGN